MEKENKIRLLPEIVANQIAAGEVVDNPSSVVKEMMENAIDAGATSVTVNFRNAGLELIQIVDDGCGMSPIDARLAFDRHATSKIRNFDDVYRLQTFGFRGEALASIAAVAQVELRTRQRDEEIGTVTIVNGGEFVSQTPTMCPVGSQFFVRNLFYTAPARRKFNGDRGKMVTEIKKVFRQVALCNPQVRCELMSSDMPIITLHSGSLLDRIIEVVGRHIKTNLLEVDVSTSIVSIKGYVGRPAAAKQKNAEQYLFVNGRYFRSTPIFRAIMKAYEKLIPENCSPSYFLYLTVEPDRVDVNVSPHKTEVRFADAEDVNQIISAAVRSTLAKSGSVGMMDFERPEVEIPVMGSDEGFVYAEPKTSTNMDYNPFVEDCSPVALPAIDGEEAAALPPMPKTSSRSSCAMPKLQPAPEVSVPQYVDITASLPAEGIDLSAYLNEEQSRMEMQSAVELQQSIALDEGLCFTDVMLLGGGYALAVSAGRSMVVDLRRVKERLLYDNYMAQLSVGSCPSQQLLFVEELVLSEDDYALLQAQEVEFAALGFDLELQGECRVLVKGVPSNLAGEQIDVLLYDMLREVEQSENIGERVREGLALMMAQNSSRKVLAQSRDQVQDMLQRLCECENYSFSPSGKAIMAELTIDELRKKLN